MQRLTGMAALCAAVGLGAGTSFAHAANVVMWVDSPLATSPDAPIYAAVKAFEKKTGNTVEVQPVPHNALEQKLVVSLSGGAGPDVMFIDVAWVAGLADAGLLKDVTAQTKPIASEYQAGPLASGRYKGRQYALPLYTNNVGLYVNDDMLAKAGIKQAPKTWKEFRNAAIAMTDPKAGTFGLSLGAGRYGAFQLYSFIWQNGGQIIAEDGSIHVADPPAVGALAFLSGLYTKDHAVPDTVLTASSWDEINAPFIQQRAGMLITGDWGIAPIAKANPNLHYSIHPLPAGKEKATVIGGYDVGINANSKVAKASWDLVRWLTGTRGPDLMRKYDRLSAATAATAPAYVAALPKKMQPFMAQAAYGHTRPVVSAWAQIHADIFANVWDSVIRGKATPQQAMDTAAAKIKTLLH